MIYLRIPNLLVLVTSTLTSQIQFTPPPTSQDLITNATFIGWITVIALGVGVVGLLVGLGLSIWLYFKSKTVKLITFEVLNEAPLMNIHSKTQKGTIKVLYEDAPDHSTVLTKPNFIFLEVKNSGNQDVVLWHEGDIDIEHSEIPIQFEFKDREVVTLTEVNINPPTKEFDPNNLAQYLDNPCPKPSFLGLPRCILKKKESIRFGILLDGPGQGIQKHGELYNGEIKNLRVLEKQKSRILIIIQVTLVSGITVITAGLVLLFRSALSILVASTIAVIIGYLILFIPLLIRPKD